MVNKIAQQWWHARSLLKLRPIPTWETGNHPQDRLGHAKIMLAAVLTAGVSVLYAWMTVRGGAQGGLWWSLADTLYLLFLASWLVSRITAAAPPSALSYLPVLFLAATHGGILVGIFLAHPSVDPLLVVDSLKMHWPGAVNFANYLAGKSPLRHTNSVFDKIYVSHVLTGTFLYLFGKTTIVASLAALCAKAGTCWMIQRIGRRLFDEQSGLIAALIYVLMPTVQFQTLVLTKEAFVHLFVAMSALGVCLFSEKRRWTGGLWIAVSLACLAEERIYLPPILLGSYVLIELFRDHMKLRTKLLIIAIGAISFDLMLLHYFDISLLSVDVLWTKVESLRHAYNAYPDINPINLTLPYPLAVLKLLFSPYPTPEKIHTSWYFSYLVFWGAFVNGIVMLLAIYGIRKKIATTACHVYLVLPIVLFLLVFAYISPYNYRLRDSFYPVIALYAAVPIMRLKRRGAVEPIPSP